MEVKLFRHTPQPDEVVYCAGRKCYSQLTASELLENLYEKFPTPEQRHNEMKRFIGERVVKEGHTSIADHIQFVFDISGVSRTLETQLVRSRIGTGFSIQSGRYTNGKNVFFVVPESFVKVGILDRYLSILEQEKEFYEDASELITAYNIEQGFEPRKAQKLAFEDARFVFSQSMATKLVASFDGTALLHFLKLRTCSHAQWEIRQMAQKMYEEVKDVAPALTQGGCSKCGDCKSKCSIIEKLYKPESTYSNQY